MTDCTLCWWYGKPIDCPAKFNIDTNECENFAPLNQNIEKRSKAMITKIKTASIDTVTIDRKRFEELVVAEKEAKTLKELLRSRAQTGFKGITFEDVKLIDSLFNGDLEVNNAQ